MSGGYRVEDIFKFSLRKINLLSEAVLKRKKMFMHDLTVAVRQAQNTNDESFQKFLLKLREGDD